MADDCLIYINSSLLYSSWRASVDSTYKYRKIRLNGSAILEADTFFKIKIKRLPFASQRRKR